MEEQLVNGEESRRYPRVLARCRVRIRDRFGVWDAETEDVGPRGCRIVLARPQTVGALVSLTLQSDRVSEELHVTGQIVWARAERPARAGVSFAGGTFVPGAVAPGPWFEIVAAAERAGATPPEPEIVIEIDDPVREAEPLAERLVRRAEQLLGGGDRAAAELIYRRALELRPDDAALQAALRDLSGH
jgi:hypothetical protein